ncbi:MAG: diacylglycerol kinase family protein [Patescibacteria group bacterium]|nr:diacylglycerol kinase family protein [Patescibacteria group bacterium]
MNLFLFNPSAKKAKLKNKIIDYLNHLKVPGEFIDIRKKEDIAKVAKEALEKKVKNIIVIGGDGMVNRLIQVIAKENVNLGIIPIGETNFLAHILKINDWKKGCEILKNPKVVPINLGLISKEKYFTSSIEIEGKDQQSKKFLGIFSRKNKSKYYPVTLSVEGDNTKFKLQTNMSSLIITTIPLPLPKNFKIEDAIDDQELKIIIKSKPEHKSRFDEITTVKGKKIEIESKGPLYIKADGEHSGKASVDIEIAPKCLNVIIPE